MKHIKKIIISTVVIGSAVLGASAFADRSEGRFQQKFLERIENKLELDDNQSAALSAFATEMQETREMMHGPDGNVREQISGLMTGETFDQTKALNMINERAAAIQTNAPELVAAAALFFDGLNAEQKAQIQKFADKRGHGWKRGDH